MADMPGAEPVPQPEGLVEMEPCPACDSSHSRILFEGTDRLYQTTDKMFWVAECGACGLIRLSPWPSPLELQQYYPPDYWYVPEHDAVSQLEELYRRFVLRDHVRFVEHALTNCTADGPILDVGCGGGLFLKMLGERGWPGIGLDFSLSAATAAWRQNEVPTICASLSHPPLPNGSCAAVTMFHVLEHLYDPVSYLESAYNLLQDDGRLIVQVPNAACWQFLLMGEYWAGVDIPRHLLNFRLKDIEILLDRCGFEVLQVKHFSLRDNPAGLATSIAPGLDPMARRIRGLNESPRQKLWKDLVYLCLVAAALPFTALEAACRAGSTVMVEARKKKA
ncbi:MAG: class I SAM-dependent methyltransferase [Bryobacterales bacterium]|nr:class I SAM-dependent methyltransferase [Bryobacterales bacterium]